MLKEEERSGTKRHLANQIENMVLPEIGSGFEVTINTGLLLESLKTCQIPPVSLLKWSEDVKLETYGSFFLNNFTTNSPRLCFRLGKADSGWKLDWGFAHLHRLERVDLFNIENDIRSYVNCLQARLRK